MSLNSNDLALDAAEHLKCRLFYILMLYFDEVAGADREYLEAKVDRMLASLVIDYSKLKQAPPPEGKTLHFSY